jgi:hypothetical protein
MVCAKDGLITEGYMTGGGEIRDCLDRFFPLPFYLSAL